MNTSLSHIRILLSSAVLLLIMALSGGCAQDTTTAAGPGTGGTGTLAKLYVTDAPASDFDHVYVTVTGVAFHTDAAVTFAGYSSSLKAGWHTCRFPSPKTVDLAQLSNGVMHAVVDSDNPLLGGISLPVGKYRQVRIFLAATEDDYVGTVSGLAYNNEVRLRGDATGYPLRVPAAADGIKVLPESPVEITEGGSTDLALDFNLSSDVIEVSPNGTKEFLLKPRLGYYDMKHVGCISGTVSFNNLSTSAIEIKAEQIKEGSGYRVVRRMTTADRTGSFSLYPLPIFGNASTARYDILIRGRNIRTTVITGVTVHAGTTVQNGIDLGSIPLSAGSDVPVQLGNAIKPSGTWLNFYQNIGTDPVPYEILYQHLDPYTGGIPGTLSISASPIQIAGFIPGKPLSFSTYTGSEKLYSMVAEAGYLYGRGEPITGIDPTGGTVKLTPEPKHHPSGGERSGSINVTTSAAPDSEVPNSSRVLVTNGGMVIDGIPVSEQTIAVPVSGGSALYDLYVLGWSGSKVSTGTGSAVEVKSSPVHQNIELKNRH